MNNLNPRIPPNILNPKRINGATLVAKFCIACCACVTTVPNKSIYMHPLLFYTDAPSLIIFFTKDIPTSTISIETYTIAKILYNWNTSSIQEPPPKYEIQKNQEYMQIRENQNPKYVLEYIRYLLQNLFHILLPFQNHLFCFLFFHLFF